MGSSNNIKRIKDKYFVTFNSKVMREKDVSLKAKGLYAMVMSLPDDWNFSLKGICSITKEEYTAVNNAIKELIEAGYCHREQVKNKGRIVGYDYIFYDKKMSSPCLENPNVEKPNVENLNDNNINSTINSSLNKKNNDEKASKDAKKNISEDEQRFLDGMNKRFPRIMKMDKPLTLEQAKKLKAKFDSDLIYDIMGRMENWKPLIKKNVSAYQTIVKWCQSEHDKV